MSFDVKQEIGMKIPTAEGLRKLAVAFPSDAQWSEWRRKKKINQKDQGRGSFQIDSGKPEPADLDLFKAILKPAAEDAPYALPADDEDAMADAVYVISRLADCEVSERPDRDGTRMTISLKIMRALTTTHTLRVPSMREMMQYERERSSVVFGKYGTQEIRVNYSAGVKLYDALVQSKTGYEGMVPAPHKAEVISVLVQEIRSQDEEGDEPGE